MEELKVIYASNAHDFIPHIFPCLVDRRPGNNILKKLRQNYAGLKEKYGSFPQKVGVITVDDIFKRMFEQNKQEIAESGLIKSTTSYLPLDILEACLALDRKVDSPLKEEYLYRSLSYFVSSLGPLVMGNNLTPKQVRLLYFGPGVPLTGRVSSKLEKLNSEIKKDYCESQDPRYQNSPILAEALTSLDNSCEILREVFPTWKDFEDFYSVTLDKFNKNKVSRDFPLNFFSNKNILISMLAVDLKDEIYTPPIDKNLLMWLELGSKAQGLDKIPEEVMESLTVGSKDLFGESENSHGIEQLLGKLPNPKTIITDLYLVDHFPQLEEIGFKTFELR